jgi:tetratricopeptide (TPR) repeat protein
VKTRLPALICCAAIAVSCSRDPHETARAAAARGDRFVQEGRQDAAVIEYRNAVRHWPTWAEAHQKLGDALMKLGRAEEAYDAFAASERIVDGEPLPFREDELRAFVDRKPASAAARIALAELLTARGELDEAETHLLAAVEAERNSELANRALAAIYMEQNLRADAERLLTVAAAQEPQRYRSRLALADLLLEDGRYAEARPILERLRDDPNFAKAAAVRLAAVDYEQGAVADASRAVADAIATDPSAEAWTLQAQFRFREGKLDDALRSAREALALDPEFTPAQDVADSVRRELLWR